MDPLYVTGHQQPDTDSIAVSVAMAFLLNVTSRPAKARRLGLVNRETAWLLA